MKQIFILILLISLAFAVGAAEVTVLSISGNVEIKEPGGVWMPATSGQTVSASSMISTGFGSRARLSAGGMELNLQPLTRLTIDSLLEDGDVTRTAVSLQTGRMRASRPPVARSERQAVDFRVSTPVATAAVRGTDFTMSFNKVNTTEGLVSFSQGQAVVMSTAGTYAWAVPGLTPVNPAAIAEEIWSVSPVAGSIGGSEGESTENSSAGNLGSAVINIF